MERVWHFFNDAEFFKSLQAFATQCIPAAVVYTLIFIDVLLGGVKWVMRRGIRKVGKKWLIIALIPLDPLYQSIGIVLA